MAAAVLVCSSSGKGAASDDDAPLLSIGDLPIEMLDAILALGTPFDRIVWAHVSRTWRDLIVAPRLGSRPRSKNVGFISVAVRSGLWHLVEWARERGCPWDDAAAVAAIDTGRRGLLERLVALGCPVPSQACAKAAATKGDANSLAQIVALGHLSRLDARYALYRAAKCGHTHVIEMLCAHDYACGNKTCWARPLVVSPRADAKPSRNTCTCAQLMGRGAARGGHTDLLEWLQERACPFDEYAMASAAKGGHIGAMAWLHANGVALTSDACCWAAERGQLDALKWLRANGCPWDESVCLHAAYKGRLNTLQWAADNGCPWGYLTTTFAAIGGHIDVAEWALSRGCALITEHDDQTVYHFSPIAGLISECTAMDVVARSGRIDVLDWLRAHGCQAMPWTFIEAARSGHIDAMDWLHEHCLPWDEEVCAELAEGGMLDALKHARAKGHPWDARVCARAAQSGRLEVLQWARANGCPWDSDSMCYVAAPHCGLATLQWLVEQGCAWDDRIAQRVASSTNDPKLLAWIVKSGRSWNSDLCLGRARSSCRQRIVAWIKAYRATATRPLRPPEPVY